MILDRSLERFSSLSLRLELDQNLPWIECEGKVVWIVPSREVGARRENYDTGIEFVGLEPAEEDLIRSYVESRVEAA